MPKGDGLAIRNKARAETMRADQLLRYTINDTGCWLFSGPLDKDGYGKLKRYGKDISAPRVYYESTFGRAQEGLWILHKCDNPQCVNPDHLYAGTRLDNERDKDLRGRRPPSPSITHSESLSRGKDHHRYGKGMPKDVADALLAANKGRPLSAEHKESLSPLTSNQVLAIRSDTRSQSAIAKDYSVGQMTICRIKRREVWKHI